jgi:hypothetical protein
VPRAADYAAEPLDIDVDQLAGAALLIAADRLLGLQAGELAQPDPLQDRGDG